MPEMGTSGLMSGDGKRDGAVAPVLAPILDSTGIPRRTSARTPTWQPERSLHVFRPMKGVVDPAAGQRRFPVRWLAQAHRIARYAADSRLSVCQEIPSPIAGNRSLTFAALKAHRSRERQRAVGTVVS